MHIFLDILSNIVVHWHDNVDMHVTYESILL